MARQFCKVEPIRITIGSQESSGGLTFNKDIRQHIHVLDSNNDKFEFFKELLEQVCTNPDGSPKQQKIIVFCGKKVGVDQLENNLRRDYRFNERVKVDMNGIHGDK